MAKKEIIEKFNKTISGSIQKYMGRHDQLCEKRMVMCKTLMGGRKNVGFLKDNLPFCRISTCRGYAERQCCPTRPIQGGWGIGGWGPQE